MLAGRPDGDLEVPSAVLELADGRDVRVVWVNQLGGVTFECRIEGVPSFVKWAPAGSCLDLAAETVRLNWVRPYSRVPEIVCAGQDAAGAWLATIGLDGESAVSDHWKKNPAVAVSAIGLGLRYLHEHAPVSGCPFTWSAEDRVKTAQQRGIAGIIHPGEWHELHRHLTVDYALSAVAVPPPIDKFVVCHGDACVPNTIVKDGTWAGHVDLGSLGVADRWADLAIATWSTEWNYGPGWESALLNAYGVDPDPERSAYYRLLWDLA